MIVGEGGRKVDRNQKGLKRGGKKKKKRNCSRGRGGGGVFPGKCLKTSSISGGGGGVNREVGIHWGMSKPKFLQGRWTLSREGSGRMGWAEYTVCVLWFGGGSTCGSWKVKLRRKPIWPRKPEAEGEKKRVGIGYRRKEVDGGSPGN